MLCYCISAWGIPLIIGLTAWLTAMFVGERKRR